MLQLSPTKPLVRHLKIISQMLEKPKLSEEDLIHTFPPLLLNPDMSAVLQTFVHFNAGDLTSMTEVGSFFSKLFLVISLQSVSIEL